MSPRRMFLRRLLGGALASAAAPAVLQAASHNAVSMPSLMGASVGAAREDPIARAALDAWEHDRERRDRKREALRARIGVLDFNVAERRSWSSAFKAHVQAQRDVARFDAHHEANSIWRRMWLAVAGGEP